MVQELLDALALHCGGSVAHVVLTINLDEPEPVPAAGGVWPFRLSVIRPEHPRGFGANHNQAFTATTEPFFCVLNPDILLLEADPFPAMCQLAALPEAGLAYPHQVDQHGKGLDHQRVWPTLPALLRRHLLGQVCHRVDWVNGACMVFARERYAQMRGFDERFFMYCEDVDICWRLRRAGYALMQAPTTVLHHVHRSSHRQWRHFFWHVRSLFLHWRTAGFWRSKPL